MRPPKPRYTYMWDVHLATKYLACPGMTKLLHLSCSQSNWQCLLPFPARNKLHPSQGLSFSSLSCLVSPDQLPQAFFASFPHNKRLCPVGTLRHYLKGTQNLRPVFHHQSQTLCLFLKSNRIIQSLHPLLADGCAWS